MKVTKLDKKQNRYYVDTAKQPINIVGAKAVGKPITKLAMYESFGEPKKYRICSKRQERFWFRGRILLRLKQRLRATWRGNLNVKRKDKYPDAVDYIEKS